MNKNTRSKVIDKAVMFEQVISEILSLLLDIENDTSLSFGSKNSALGFNSKINLLADLKFVSSEIASDFQMFAEIRNKFAHVLAVDSFTKCFDILKDKKNKFKKYGGRTDEKSLLEELYLEICFNNLCSQLEIWLKSVTRTIAKRKRSDIKKDAFISITKLYLMSKDSDSEKYKNLFLTAQTLMPEIEDNMDFMEEVERERKKLISQ